MIGSRKAAKLRRKRRRQDLPEVFTPGFLIEMDSRTFLARRLRDNYDRIIAELGGEDAVGHVKASMVERFVWMEAYIQTVERKLAAGELAEEKAFTVWISAVNSIIGVAKVVGIDRKNIAKPWLNAAGATRSGVA